MYAIIGWVVLGIVGFFLFSYYKFPNSAVMSGFKTKRSFYFSVSMILIVSIGAFSAHFYARSQEPWRASQIFQLKGPEGDIHLYTGQKEKAAINYDKQIHTKRPYKTNLLLWDGYDEITLHVTQRGDKDSSYKKVYVNNAIPDSGVYRIPVTLTFPEKGKWRIDIYNEGEPINAIVVDVQH
ncbi:hypothetical protein [Pseudalkalibacillus caeni]|uniref:Uncharacterized protein n=1 Tax=Exobacillus caeni TaxID=2574798 RepID=A0A5R9F5W3_9BACL|nr:hypothetical protein [Pseudalkalibacillus caeni]TLS35195.1 hypothetical protein FCL54_21590 [Pseudalkalibacillus caeni]